MCESAPRILLIPKAESRIPRPWSLVPPPNDRRLEQIASGDDQCRKGARNRGALGGAADRSRAAPPLAAASVYRGDRPDAYGERGHESPLLRQGDRTPCPRRGC